MSVRGVDWDLEGNRLSIKNALALCYAYGFKGGKKVITAVCVMTAESQRYVRAWHVNRNPDGTAKSTDRGLFQVNDLAHPQYTPEELFRPRENVQAAFDIYLRRGGTFTAWAAFNSKAHLKFWPLVAAVWVMGRWKDRVFFWGD